MRRTACLLFEDSVRFGPEGVLPLIKVFLQMGQAEGRCLQVGWLGLHLTAGSPLVLLLCCCEFRGLGLGSASWGGPMGRSLTVPLSGENRLGRRVAFFSLLHMSVSPGLCPPPAPQGWGAAPAARTSVLPWHF